ncbi:secreted RxLR effector protein 161-like [Spinacia oleracea]|uniref:Secreted RxLR effector protein 161-like n=1 Tax=Spinacia oleracea TaxID=3562 RepID=A0ABM3QQ51_SPIOL|nr:secreted RxLR effector protein 161-like [Spinacia oleracea]
MVVRSLDVDEDPFHHREDDEEILCSEVSYLSAIGALMYLASHTRPAISFSEGLVDFADAGYLSDPHIGRSQTGYLFTCGGTAISWGTMKQIIAATSSNHYEILAIHEASRECVWHSTYKRRLWFNLRERGTNNFI